MPVDWDAGLNDIYNAMAVPAVLRTGYGADVALSILDKSQGVMLENQHGGQLFAAAKPAAYVRVTELDAKAVSRDSLKGATLSFKGETWRIIATQPRPKPGSKGELHLILQTP